MSDSIEMFAICDHETDKALLVILSDQKKIWVPKSVVHIDSEVQAKGDEGTLTVQKWFAEKEGFDIE